MPDILKQVGPQQYQFLKSQLGDVANNNKAADDDDDDVPQLVGNLEDAAKKKEALKEVEQNREEVGGASVDYLMYSGFITLAYFWADMARESMEKLAAGTDDADFYKAKIATARFYFQRMLPRVAGHKAMMTNGVESMMALDAEHFAF